MLVRFDSRDSLKIDPICSSFSLGRMTATDRSLYSSTFERLWGPSARQDYFWSLHFALSILVEVSFVKLDASSFNVAQVAYV
jgi:hypothetical protein